MPFLTYIVFACLLQTPEVNTLCLYAKCHNLAWRKPERAPGIITDERLQSSCKWIYPRCHCRINLRESKETLSACSNIPWHVYILAINNPRKDCWHLFADSVFGLEMQKINKMKPGCHEKTGGWRSLLLREMWGKRKWKCRYPPSGTWRLIRTDDRRSFRIAAALWQKTAADACESNLDAWTPLDLQRTPKSQNRHIHPGFKKCSGSPQINPGRRKVVVSRWELSERGEFLLDFMTFYFMKSQAPKRWNPTAPHPREKTSVRPEYGHSPK